MRFRNVLTSVIPVWEFYSDWFKNKTLLAKFFFPPKVVKRQPFPFLLPSFLPSFPSSEREKSKWGRKRGRRSEVWPVTGCHVAAVLQTTQELRFSLSVTIWTSVVFLITSPALTSCPQVLTSGSGEKALKRTNSKTSITRVFLPLRFAVGVQLQRLLVFVRPAPWAH